jgi:hypothetical protein
MRIDSQRGLELNEINTTIGPKVVILRSMQCHAMSPSPRPYQIGGAEAINITKHGQRPGDIPSDASPDDKSQY